MYVCMHVFMHACMCMYACIIFPLSGGSILKVSVTQSLSSMSQAGSYMGFDPLALSFQVDESIQIEASHGKITGGSVGLIQNQQLEDLG